MGIFFMYSSGTIAIGNTVKNSLEHLVLELVWKTLPDFTLLENNLIYNPRGLYLDQSPYHPRTVNVLKEIIFCTTQVVSNFKYQEREKYFKENVIKGNIEPVVSDTPRNNLDINDWSGNYWDMYEGFDKMVMDMEIFHINTMFMLINYGFIIQMWSFFMVQLLWIY